MARFFRGALILILLGLAALPAHVAASTGANAPPATSSGGGDDQSDARAGIDPDG